MPPWQVTLKLTEPPEQLFAKCDEITTVQHSAGTFSHSSLRPVWSEAKSRLHKEWRNRNCRGARRGGLRPYNEESENSAGRVVEEDDVGGTPHGGGDGAVGLAGDDDLEKFG